MTKIANIKSVLPAIFMLFSWQVNSCSMYKITVAGKTIIGCNEDAWRSTPRIWFETARSQSTYSAAFTGSRFDGGNGYAPQSGMNEMGLAYSRLASMAPEMQLVPAGKKSIQNPTRYLKDILHTCKSVDEVKSYISGYDYNFFIEDVFIYVEKSGRYLVVEPYAMTIGTDANYVLSNFCPSVTPQTDALKLDRYRKGIEFLNAKKAEASLSFCTDFSNAMHVCRDKIGDGTLLTSIWDSANGSVDLFFYHRYDKSVHFNLEEEWAKGDHIVALPALFATNSEFEKLKNFKTPQNSDSIGLFLLFCGFLFFFSAWYFLVAYLRKRGKVELGYVLAGMFLLNLALTYYMYVLFRVQSVFYFPAPYKHPHNDFVSLASYLPVIVLLLIVPISWTSFKLFKQKQWSVFTSSLFALNNFILCVLLLLFGYWKFFDVI